MPTWKILEGDVRDRLADLGDGSVQCVVTSPPYWGLRDYGVGGQLGLEPTPEEYVATMVAVFHGVWRVLRDDGTLWLNMGDSYLEQHGLGFNRNARMDSANRNPRSRSRPSGLKSKDLSGLPWILALALREDGWWLRDCIIWHKPNGMPESVSDRTTRAHEYVFLLTRSATYYYDADAIREPHQTPPSRRNRKHGAQAMRGQESIRPRGNLEAADDPELRYYHEGGRNRRSVWTIATEPCTDAHFATFPTALVEPCVKAGSREGDTVLDPFAGSGTTLVVAIDHGRHAVGIELNPEYAALARRRLQERNPLFAKEDDRD